MNNIIAFFQVGKINVERGTCGLRVRGFLAARPLDFVTAKNFRIRDDDEFGFVANEATGEGAEMRPKSKVQGCACSTDFGLWTLDFGFSIPCSFQISSNRSRSPSLLQKRWTE